MLEAMPDTNRACTTGLADTVSGIPKLRSLLLDSLPSAFHVPGLSVGLADADPKREFAVELGMREKKVAAGVQPVHQKLIGMISHAQPEADEIKLSGRGQFETRIVAHPTGELLRQSHVLANVVLQPFDPVMPDHKPKLERTKTASELDVPVAIINNRAGFTCLIAQVLGQDRKRLDQVLPVGDVEAAAIEVGEHPFVRVEAVTVGELNAIVDEAKFRAERGRAAQG